MYFRNYVFALIAVIFISGNLFQHSAYAFDTGAFLKQLEDSAQEKGNTFSYRSLEDESDGSFTLKDVVIEDKSEGQNVKIGELNFLNPELLGDKGLSFDALTARDYVQDGKGKDGNDFVITVSSLHADSFELPNLDDRDNPLWPANIETLVLDDVKIVSESSNKEDVTIQSPGLTLKGLESKSGNNFTLASLIMEPATGTINSEEKDLNLGFDGLRVEGVEHFGKTGFEMARVELGSMQIAGQNAENQEIDFKFGGARVNNFYIADPTITDRPMVSEKPMTMNIGELNTVVDGKEFMGWKGASGNSKHNTATGTGNGSLKFSDIYIDFWAAPVDGKEKKNLEQIIALGYDRLYLNIDALVSWNLVSGDISMDKYRFDFADAGALELSGKVSGYTEDVARKISIAANEANAETDPEKQQLKSMQMLATMASLAVEGLTISVEDKSLLNKIIAFQAAQANQEPEQLKQIVGPMAQIMMAPLNIPEFAASATQALNIFMQGNKTITVSAKPENGLVMTEIIALTSAAQAGSVAPAEIIDRLNLEVVAE